MIQGGKKFEKTNKTKFKKDKDLEGVKINKQKHYDKLSYRLYKKEKENVLHTTLEG